jgi:hypothetical protein
MTSALVCVIHFLDVVAMSPRAIPSASASEGEWCRYSCKDVSSLGDGSVSGEPPMREMEDRAAVAVGARLWQPPAKT